MKTKIGKLMKTFAFALSILMLIISLPISAFATMIETSDYSNNIVDESNATKEAVVLEEDESLREENIKHFKLSDGITKAVVYPRAVHYKDENGEWVDIDNALTLNGSEYSTSNKSQIKFANKSGSNGLVSIKDGEYKIDFTPLNTNKVNVVIENPQSNNSRKFEDISVLNNLVSKATYADIYDGIDIEYILVGNNIKENIIVKEKQDSYTFSFELKLNELSAKLEKGAIVLSDYDSGERVYEIPVPYMLDANNVYSPNVEYSLVQESKWKYIFTVIADAEWINSAERTFPVTIDPSLGITDDNFVDYSVSPYEEVSVPETELWVGNGFVSYIQLTSLPQLPNSAYITESTVSLKHLFGGTSSENGGYIGVHRAYGEYPKDYVRVAPNSDGTYGEDGWYTWNIIDIVNGWYNSQITSYNLCFDAVSSTEMVKLSSKENADRPLLTISYRDMKGAESYWSYISQGAGNAGNGSINLATGNLMFEIGTMSTTDSLFAFMPTMIYNSALAGLEYKYGYENAQIGYWGTYAANGFKVNINEAIIKDTYINSAGESETYYIWADSDGTEHYFIADENGIYRDEDGLQLTLSANDSDVTQDCIITDSAHNQRIFEHMSGVVSTEIEATWYLSKIRDVNGNELYFQIDGSKKPNDIKIIPNGSSAITMISPLYNSNSRLALLWNNSIKEGVVFRHSNTPTGELSANGGVYLREALYIKCDSDIGWSYVMNNFLGDFENNTEGVTVNAVMKYTYDEDGYLTVAHDTLSDYKVQYTYTNGKVTSVTEYGKNNAEGQTIVITYNSGYTEVRTSGSNDIYGDSDDLINVYTFDNQGRAISSYSINLDRTEIYGATSGEYVSDNENAKNSLKISTVTSNLSPNYLFNGNFELSDSELSKWTTYGNVELHLEGQNGWDNASAILSVGKEGMSSISQVVSLYSGEYTLYMDIATMSTSNSSIGVVVECVDSPNIKYTHIISTDEITTSAEKNLSFFTFEIEDGESGRVKADYRIQLKFLGASGAVEDFTDKIKVDNLMLSKHNGAEPYNAVQNGSFEQDSMISSSQNGVWETNVSTNTIISTNSLTQDEILKVEAYMGENRVGQTIYEATDAIKTQFLSSSNYSSLPLKLFVSGFGKATFASQAENSVFGLRLEVSYLTKNGVNEIVSKYFNFNTDSKEWQFVSGIYSVPENNKLITKIRICCEYSNNLGTAYFDNISVQFEPTEAVVEYDYYDNGKLKTEKTNSDVVLYTYNENGDVLDVATRTGWTHYNYESTSNPYAVSSEEYYTREELLPYQLDTAQDIYNSLSETSTLKTITTYVYNEYGLVTKSTVKTEENIEAEEQSEETENEEKDLTTEINYVYNIIAGSRIFGSVYCSIEASGKTTRYYYDDKSGRLNLVRIDNGTGYYYTYDDIGNLIKVLPYNYASYSEKIEYEYTNENHLEKIIAGDMEYIFTYDDFGNQNSIYVGEQQLVSQIFNANNGKASEFVYANGIKVLYEYDKLERISKTTYVDTTKTENNTIEYSYEYDSNGNVNKVIDGKNNTTTMYKYDAKGQLERVLVSNNTKDENTLSVIYSRDEYSRITSVVYDQTVFYGTNSAYLVSHNYEYAYNQDGTLKEMTICFEGDSDGYTINYGYDSFGRCTSKALEIENATITSSQDYYKNGENTTSIISKYETVITKADGTKESNPYYYVYDSSFENIIGIKASLEADELLIRYEYDDLNRLVREDNAQSGYTWLYSYDDNGNLIWSKQYHIMSPNVVDGQKHIATYQYAYSNQNWKDQLTSYNGATITYDANGNPLSYWDGTTFTWENGNKLATVQNPMGTITYTYNSDGIRTSKTVYGVKHTYVLEGSRIISESYEDTTVVYLYDELNSPIGLMYKKGEGDFEKYFFVKNLQGDILKVYTESGEKAVEYKYDAWGKLLSTTASGAYSHMSGVNRLLYRGYYYDSETEYYYLNSRYYDPQVKRFISPDNVNYLGANDDMSAFNLYAYCSNNPVMYSDPAGGVAIAASIALITITVAIAIVILSDPTVQDALSDMVNEIGNFIDDCSNKINNSHPDEYTVYSLLDPDTYEVKYVGRTKNYEARMKQHKKNDKTKDLILGLKVDHLDYSTARGVEQIGIVSYNTIKLGKNSINGVGPKNKNRLAYLKVAYNYLYNQFTNEWYNFLGK